ncbi:hypothetical protein ACF9IK_05755 [Kitasatospora hibisci]|uniref:hypothetical protein n=1 Tax=Kitasatospora hibisci TaxID=3369522 RepID=UPI0037549C0A
MTTPTTPTTIAATPPTAVPGAAWVGAWRGTVTQGREKYVALVHIHAAKLGEEFATAEYAPLGCSTAWTLTEATPEHLAGRERVTRNTSTTCINGDFTVDLREDGTILFDWGRSVATGILTRE